MIIDRVKARWKEARLSNKKNIAAMLSTLIGDVDNRLKRVANDGSYELSDGTVISIIKSFIANAEDTLHIIQGDDRYEADRISLEEQIEELKHFLPVMMTEDEIREFFVEPDITTLKEAMKRIKDEKPFLYDGKLASQIAKEMFT